MAEGQGERIRVVVCEDDDDLRNILLEGLPAEQMVSVGMPSAEALFRHLAEARADILLLDLGLPGEDGLSAGRRVRQEFPQMGIVILTARGEMEDRIRGLAGGADQYFVKPVDLRELAITIRNLHARLKGGHSREPAAWTLDRVACSLGGPDGSRIPLGRMEFLIVKALMTTPGQTVRRSELLALLDWEEDAGSSHRLGAVVSRLRQKVREACPTYELPMKSRHGSGYAFLAPGTIL